ncbi:class I SAM-dependent methyltransferase [Chitinophaga sp. Hz27]|uniref:class I SAM-dependent methyltransferase n=1 Tax=Chitinophaga sp. Hz27 TaxID=3347169 RepID=UPI0035DCC212
MESSNIWDQQYSQGSWDVLKSEKENARQETARQLIYKYAFNGTLLEVGCGEGLLQQHLNPDAYTFFTGVDFSAIAINRAAALNDHKTSYIVADMEVYTPPHLIDLILFNESIYYAKNPLDLLRRYMPFLRDNGVMMTSIFSTGNNLKIIKQIHESFDIVDEIITSNERGSWYCTVFSK